jgi:choline dehydrogenase-like flavoprotein
MPLSNERLRVLAAVCDAFVPAVDRDDPEGYYRRKASDAYLPQILDGVLAFSPPRDQAELEALLDLLASPNLGATWGGPARGILELEPADRERVLLAWQQSPARELRAAYQVLSGTVLGFHYGFATEQMPNLTWKSIGYPGPRAAPAAAPALRPLVVEGDAVLDCDAVVVGSGAGGGVVAGELAEAGQDVIVLEKGPYVSEEGFTQRELEMMAQLYERGGSLRTRDKAIAVLAGSCVGGGTTVNWTGALRLPDFVREEWARDHGNTQLVAELDASIEAIERAANVGTEESVLDEKARRLVAGCEALGYAYKLYPRNVKGCDPAMCGYCVFGCRRGAKQGTMRTWLQRAQARGARLLPGAEVSRVVVEAGAAVGVEATQVGAGGRAHRVTVRARRVIVAAGSIHTPALLRRSGLAHPEIGRNLYLHPACGVPARYPEPIRGWEGPPMPVSCDEFTRLDGNHGFKIVNSPLHPVWLSLVPWLGGADHKQRMLDSERLGSMGPFVRDRDTGRVDLDESGQPIVDYTPSAYDLAHLRRGVMEAARLHVAAGAELVYLPGPTLFETSGGRKKLDETLEAMPASAWELHRSFMMSAHQMGTCRMGADAARHPLTPAGETREVKDLFVADASVFPTCSGANPMPTIQAIAHHTAQGIKARG